MKNELGAIYIDSYPSSSPPGVSKQKQAQKWLPLQEISLSDDPHRLNFTYVPIRWAVLIGVTIVPVCDCVCVRVCACACVCVCVCVCDGDKPRKLAPFPPPLSVFLSYISPVLIWSQSRAPNYPSLPVISSPPSNFCSTPPPPPTPAITSSSLMPSLRFPIPILLFWGGGGIFL